MTADPNAEPVMIDPVLAERARAAYRARDVLFGMEIDPSDIIIVADWLMTGEARLALEFDRALTRNAHDYPEPDEREQGAAERPLAAPHGLSPVPDVDD